MPNDSGSPEELRKTPLRFLQSDQFVEMLQTYGNLKPLEGKPKKTFAAALAKYDFEQIYPLMDLFLETHVLATAESRAKAVAEAAPETVKFAATLLEIFETTVADRTLSQYDILGNSPATYFICGVWANMKRGREFHPASNGITVTYSEPDAYGNQNISYRNKDYEMTLMFEAVSEYTKKLSWTAHRLLVYTLMQGNVQNWRNNCATFTVSDYMTWAGLKSRDATYRQLKGDVQSITGVKLTAESYKKYFESFYTTHLATEAQIKKYTGEVRITFAENVRHFLTQYYQLIPDWMGHLSENAYRMAFYLFYRARKDPRAVSGAFHVGIEDIVEYIGLPTKAEVKNRNYDEAIMKPFNKAVEEIESISGGSFTMDFDYDNINTFLSGQMTVGVDAAMTDYIEKLDKARTAKRLESGKKKPRKKAKKEGDESAAQ
ncbi:MAG: hypothetical protein LKJ86_03960 [Oscillibacter sp.]|jgi:hypothetical protein|nr:hypothetical protein [Oscillibacter sp.]